MNEPTIFSSAIVQNSNISSLMRYYCSVRYYSSKKSYMGVFLNETIIKDKIHPLKKRDTEHLEAIPSYKQNRETYFFRELYC